MPKGPSSSRPSSIPPQPPAGKRLNINLSPQTAADLQSVVDASGRSMTEVVRSALSLVKLAQEVRSKNQKLIVADANDKPLKEVVIA